MKLMTEGTIWKRILAFSVPLILGNLLQQMYNTVDSIIVGNYVGSSALAAVGSSTALTHLLIAFSQGASVGASVVVSQNLGAENHHGVSRSVHTALAISVLLGLFLTIAGICLTPIILVWMQTPKEVMEEAVSYLQIYSGGLLFAVVYNMCAGILNAEGNSSRSLLYLGAASVTNIGLDLILIRGFSMGVEGAAIATDISQAVSCLLALRFLARDPSACRFRIKRLRIDRGMAAQIIGIGFPTGVQGMIVSLSNVLVQSSVNGFGAAAMAGFGAYMKIDGFNILPVTSFGMAITTFIGQNFGAGKLDRVKKGMKVTLLMGVVYTLITGAFLLLFSRQVVGLFTQDEEVIDYGVRAMRYFCPFYFLIGIMQILAGAVRGTGKTIPPMLILITAQCVFRVLWVQLVVPHFPSIETVYLLYPISWGVGAVLMALYTKKSQWLTSAGSPPRTA